MPPNFCLVPHAAQGDANELAPQRPRNRPTQRCLSHARRTDKAEDRSFHVLFQFADGEVLQNSCFDLFEIVMIFIQYFFSFVDVQIIFGGNGPGQIDQPVDIGSGNCVLCHSWRHLCEAIQFTQRLFLDLIRHFRLIDFISQLIDFRSALIALPQLPLNRFQLFPQVKIALVLPHFRLHLGLNFRADFQHFDFPIEVNR